MIFGLYFPRRSVFLIVESIAPAKPLHNQDLPLETD